MLGRRSRTLVGDIILTAIVWWMMFYAGHASDIPSPVQQAQRSVCRVQIKESGGHSHGSGVLISDRWVLSASHNFRSGSKRVRCLFVFGRIGSPAIERWGNVVSRSGRNVDTALVQLERSAGIPPVEIASVDATPGDTVWLCGYAGSSLQLDIIPSRMRKVYQFAVLGAVGASCVRPGQSGGGCFNSQGELLGVISGSDPRINESIALNASGTRGWLGRSLSGDIAPNRT